MDIDVSFDGRLLPISVADPHHMDMETVLGEIRDHFSDTDLAVQSLGLADLLPRMVKGIAGCENGCPANAQALVRAGFGEYRLAYVEGGILTASYEVQEGKSFEIKMFPEF